MAAAADGGAATVAVSQINIDAVKPKVRITGLPRPGHHVTRAPHARCAGRDALSGLASCKLTRHTRKKIVSYTATATDKAGNSATARGRVTLR